MNACNACGGWLGPDSGRSYTICRECIVKRAEQAERERDEARAKVERLQRFVDAFDATDYAAISRELAETPAGNVHHGKETQSVRALGIARAALEDK